MNSKKTNRLVVILNIILMVTIHILYYSSDYIFKNIMVGLDYNKSIFNSVIIDTFICNINITMLVVYIGIGIINIICAIQNKKNKKLCFWFLIYGKIEGVNTSIFMDTNVFLSTVNFDFPLSGSASMVSFFFSTLLSISSVK